MNLETFTEKLEELFIKYLLLFCMVIAIGLTFAYANNWIQNIKGTLSDIITFASLIFAVLGLILTLLISIKDGKLFKNINENFPRLTNEILVFLTKIILISIFVVLICLLISVLPKYIPKNIKLIICYIGFTSFFYMFLGAAYMMVFTTNLVIKDMTKTKKERMV